MLVSCATSSHVEHNTYCALEAKVILYILVYLQWLNQFVLSVKEIWTKIFHLRRKPKLFFQILVLYSAENNLHLFLKIYFMLLFAIWKEIRWKIFAVCLLYYYSLARRNNDFPRRKHYCKIGLLFFFVLQGQMNIDNLKKNWVDYRWQHYKGIYNFLFNSLYN